MASMPSEIDANVASWPPSRGRSCVRNMVAASTSSTDPSIATARHSGSVTATMDMT